MKITARVISLNDAGDRITVEAQGEYPSEGRHWSSTKLFKIDMPARYGNKLVIGQELKMTITPGKKP